MTTPPKKPHLNENKARTVLPPDSLMKKSVLPCVFVPYSRFGAVDLNSHWRSSAKWSCTVLSERAAQQRAPMLKI